MYMISLFSLGSPSWLVFELLVGACLIVGNIQTEAWYFLTRDDDISNL